MDFYDAIAEQYDSIVGAAGREAGAEALVDWLIERFAPSSAVDAACGTGLYARALAQRGVRVVAADISAEMIAQGRAVGDADGRIDWRVAPMQELPERLDGPMGAALCMGNSLAHLPDRTELDAALSALANLLAGGAPAVVQMVNYDRVYADRRRVVGLTGGPGGPVHVRFYDFLDDQRVRFNILSLDFAGEAPSHELRSAELRAWRFDELVEAMSDAGFEDIERYGGAPDRPWRPGGSPGLLLVGLKGAER